MADGPTGAEKAIDALMAELGRAMSEQVERDNAICTNWVRVAEWSTVDGEQWNSRWWDEKRPVWQRDGMLHQALYGKWGDDHDS
jgi:hypothetical protein